MCNPPHPVFISMQYTTEKKTILARYTEYAAATATTAQCETNIMEFSKEYCLKKNNNVFYAQKCSL